MNNLCIILLVVILLVWLLVGNNKDNFSSSLAVISSKNPTHLLLETVNAIKKFYPEFDIVIVDSDSSNFEGYKKIPKDVKIDYIKNKNYELGAWYYAYHTYPNYNTYMLIQDSVIPLERIPQFDTTNNIYKFHHRERVDRFNFILPRMYEVYSDYPLLNNLDRNTEIDILKDAFFIANNNITRHLVKAEEVYINKNIKKDKIDSYLAERALGKILETLPTNNVSINKYFQKINGGRL